MCGPSEDPLCHDGRVWQEVRRLRECPEALGMFWMDFKNIGEFWSLIKTQDLLVCDIIKRMPYNGCSQMVSISLKTQKSFIAHPCCLLSVVGLEEYSDHDWRAATSVQRAPVTWREWGLWDRRLVWLFGAWLSWTDCSPTFGGGYLSPLIAIPWIRHCKVW